MYTLLLQDWAVTEVLNRGVSPDNILMGLSTYGRSFTLDHPNNTVLGAPASMGKGGVFAQEDGKLAYYEVR